MQYTVVWEVEVEADSPEQAAMSARHMQLDFQSEADCFDVFGSDGNTFTVYTGDLLSQMD